MRTGASGGIGSPLAASDGDVREARVPAPRRHGLGLSDARKRAREVFEISPATPPGRACARQRRILAGVVQLGGRGRAGRVSRVRDGADTQWAGRRQRQPSGGDLTFQPDPLAIGRADVAGSGGKTRAVDAVAEDHPDLSVVAQADGVDSGSSGPWPNSAGTSVHSTSFTRTASGSRSRSALPPRRHVGERRLLQDERLVGLRRVAVAEHLVRRLAVRRRHHVRGQRQAGAVVDFFSRASSSSTVRLPAWCTEAMRPTSPTTSASFSAGKKSIASEGASTVPTRPVRARRCHLLFGRLTSTDAK